MSLQLDGVTVVYQRRGRPAFAAVLDVTVRVEKGEIVGLVGESGSGKSTLGRVAVGLVRPTTGIVLFDGDPVAPLRARARTRRQLLLQMVLQNPSNSLNPRRRVAAQIADGMSSLKGTRRHRHALSSELLERLGLPRDSLGKYPHQFSGGERQRIAIARALATSPSILVLDEPLSALDASNQAQLAVGLRDLADSGVGLLLISHDLAILRHIVDRFVVMYLGTVVEAGPSGPVWNQPLHPYTEALIAAIPRPEGGGPLPLALPGEIGDPADPPAGCRFHPRCPYAHGRCTTDTPPLVEVARGRSVACWLQQPGRPVRSPADQLADPFGRVANQQ